MIYLGFGVVCGCLWCGLWCFVVVCGVLWWFVVFSATRPAVSQEMRHQKRKIG